ncbi:MAG: hypothetical protein GY935_21510 [Gammaproteobacteria bacterium]|nr:hypothetical protein [Gammaproteobacteria bacterium]
MSKSNRFGNKAGASKSAHRATVKKRKWRDFRRFILTFVILAGVVGSGLTAFKYSHDVSHDLSVLGKGVPAVVQIHDPKCQLCNQLRSNASAAAESFGERLLYRIADITTPRGRQLQLRHEVQHVTLLLFDGNGELRKVLTGVKSEDILQRAFRTHLARWGDDLQGKTQINDYVETKLTRNHHNIQ